MNTCAPFDQTDHLPSFTALRWQIRRAMADGGLWTVKRIAHHLRPVWGDDLPSTEWLTALLSDDAGLRQVTPGRWVHLGAAVDGRVFTVRPSPDRSTAGILGIDADLAPALTRFDGLPAIDVRTPAGRGLARRVVGNSQTEVLVLPVRLPVCPGELLGIVPDPEGITVRPVAAEPMATSRLCRSLIRSLPGTAAGPSAPETVEAQLTALAVDPMLRQGPSEPVTDLLRTRQSSRPMGHVVGDAAFGKVVPSV